MRWPWSKRSEPEDSPDVQRAQRRLDDVRSKDAEVDAIAARLKRIYDGNSMAAGLAATIRGHR